MDQDSIEQAKRVNIFNYLEIRLGLVPQKRLRDGSIMYFSPFRQENVPSLHVSYEEGIYKWFDFGSARREGGDTIEFVRTLKGYGFREAVKELLSFDGSEEVYQRHTQLPSRPKKNTALDTMKNILWAKKFYNELPLSDEKFIRKYFTDRGLQYYQDLGCKMFHHYKDKVTYIVFPLPNIENLRGLELREICSLEKELLSGSKKKELMKRKNYGTKTLWVFKRDTSRILITESILDSLAGEIILNDFNISLAALNGVGQVAQLDGLLKSLNPEKAILATDNDESGRESQKLAIEILKSNNVNYELLETKAKDLLRELHTARKEVKTNATNNKRIYKLNRKCSSGS